MLVADLIKGKRSGRFFCGIEAMKSLIIWSGTKRKRTVNAQLGVSQT
jgi:hypothetical protein